MTPKFHLWIVAAVLLAIPAGAQTPPVAVTIEDTFRGSLNVEVESPQREGDWLPAGEVQSSGTRTTRAAPVAEGWELSVTTNRWGDPAASTATQTLTVPDVENAGDPETVATARRKLTQIRQRAAGGRLCTPEIAPGSACPEFGELLPLPKLSWVVTAINGSTLTLETDASPALPGLSISRLSATVEETSGALRWSVRGQGVDTANSITINNEEGTPVAAQFPKRVTFTLEGSSALHPAG
jgi:hypothetical protein